MIAGKLGGNKSDRRKRFLRRTRIIAMDDRPQVGILALHAQPAEPCGKLSERGFQLFPL